MEPQKQLNLVQITAPGLNKSNYGEQLDQQFQNIDSNFKKIVSTDFLKGNTGDSVQLMEVEFKEGGRRSLGLYLNEGENKLTELTDGMLYEKIKQAILSALSRYVNGTVDETNYNVRSQLVNVGNLTWKDWLRQSNKMTFLYKTNDSNKRIIISSLQYTFMDARFNNIQYSNISSYEGAVDLSCIIFLNDNNGASVFSRVNTFPTIYYDTNMESADSTENNKYGTFCWRINGNDTGIPAVGPRGKTGKDNKIYVVRVDQNTDASNECIIKEVLYVSDTETYFMPIDEFVKQDVHFDEGVFVLAIKDFERVSEYASNTSDSSNAPDSTINPVAVTNGTHMWASPLIVDKININNQIIKSYKAYCDASNSILNTFEAQSILNAMCSMYDSTVFHGLVIPISGPQYNPVTGTTKQAGHMIYALRPKIINDKEYNECVDLIVAPIDNIRNKPTDREYTGAGIYNNADLDPTITFLYDTVRIGNKLQSDGDVYIKDELIVDGATNLRSSLTTKNATIEKGTFDDGLFKQISIGGAGVFSGSSSNASLLTKDKNDEDVFSIFVQNDGYSEFKQHYLNNDINLKEGGKLRIYGGTTIITNSDGYSSSEDNEILNINFIGPDEDDKSNDVKISLYKNTEIYGDLDVGGYLEAMTMNIEQQLIVGQLVRTHNMVVGNRAEVLGIVHSAHGFISEGQIKISGNASFGGGLLTVKVDRDSFENGINVNTDSYFKGDINVGKRQDPGSVASEDNSIHAGIKIHANETIDDLIKNLEITREYNHEGYMGAIVSDDAKNMGKWNHSVDTSHKIKKVNSLTSIFSNNKFSDEVTFSDTRFKQFDPMWKYPLAKKFDSWTDTPSFTLSYENNYVVWNRGSKENVDEYKIKFDKDITALFTISGRNLYSRPWLKKAAWASPKLERAKMIVDIVTTYGSDSGGGDASITENIVDTGWIQYGQELFDMKDTKKYDEDQVNKNNKNNRHWGDTFLGAFTVSPNRAEYSIDGSNLKSISIYIRVEFDFYRTTTNKEKSQTFKTWRSAKILGFIPSARSANGTTEIKKIDNWFSYSGTIEQKPLDDLDENTANTYFNKMIYMDKVDDMAVSRLPFKTLGQSKKSTITEACTGVFNKNTFDWGKFGDNDKMTIKLYANTPQYDPILKVESINISSNFTGGNVHVCPDGILLVSPATTSSSGDNLNFAYMEVGENGRPPTINAVSTKTGGTYKVSMSLYDLIYNNNGGTEILWTN